MNSDNFTSKTLCVYQDEAVGASPIPLVIIGKNLRVSKSSDYFMNSGIVINLELSETNEIRKIKLGADICLDVQAMRDGIEVGPLGLFPVHILQLNADFDSTCGGTLRFGFLKKIFVKESFAFAMKRVFSKLTGLNLTKAFTSESDLSKACVNAYTEKNWGSFDIVIKKTATDEWAIYEAGSEPSEKAVQKIVARFNVNRAGVALGIEEMYCE
ncbi:MAG: hypothetical protein H7256_13485 [Bdellovibrio sp.]|nr:hypothetical protein [Bdellovibrio sp.]